MIANIYAIERDASYWRAILEAEDGTCLEVSDRLGHWHTEPGPSGRFHSVLPAVAAQLQNARKRAERN